MSTAERLDAPTTDLRIAGRDALGLCQSVFLVHVSFSYGGEGLRFVGLSDGAISGCTVTC